MCLCVYGNTLKRGILVWVFQLKYKYWFAEMTDLEVRLCLVSVKIGICYEHDIGLLSLPRCCCILAQVVKNEKSKFLVEVVTNFAVNA